MRIEGIEVTVQPASFINAMGLQKSIGDALRKSGINIDVGSVDINMEDPLKSDIGSDTIGSIIENGISIATDPEVMKWFFKCSERVVLVGDDKDIIDEQFFDNIKNRELYYPILIEVIKVNLSPFFAKISSMFSGVGELMQKFQK